MAEKRQTFWTDERLARIVGGVLRAGVVAAALLTLIGGVLYLRENAAQTVNYRTFNCNGACSLTLSGIADNVRHAQSLGIIQLGLLLLVLTPIFRVVFSAVTFALQRDWVYVIVTLIVMAALFYSLIGHGLK